MTLDKLMEHGKEAAEFLFKEQGAIHPMWICETESGQIIPICIEMPERDERDSVARALKESFRRNNIVRYVAMLESWIIEVPADDASKVDLSESLEFHPDRREVIFITAEDKDGTELAGQYYILRPEKGEPKLSEFKDMSDPSKPSEGRFVRLLTTEN